MIWELPTICSSIYSAAQRSCENSVAAMVTVVQLVEHQVVILGVAGSSPVSHPNASLRHFGVGGTFVIPKPLSNKNLAALYNKTALHEEVRLV